MGCPKNSRYAALMTAAAVAGVTRGTVVRLVASTSSPSVAGRLILTCRSTRRSNAVLPVLEGGGWRSIIGRSDSAARGVVRVLLKGRHDAGNRDTPRGEAAVVAWPRDWMSSARFWNRCAIRVEHIRPRRRRCRRRVTSSRCAPRCTRCRRTTGSWVGPVFRCCGHGRPARFKRTGRVAINYSSPLPWRSRRWNVSTGVRLADGRTCT